MKRQSNYIPIPNILKDYSKRLSKLHNQVLVMKHYWKIRCEERKTFTERNRRLKLLLTRMQKVEKRLSNLFNRKHFIIKSSKSHKSRGGDQCYPLFLSHNDYTRLRSFLKRDRTHDKRRGI